MNKALYSDLVAEQGGESAKPKSVAKPVMSGFVWLNGIVLLSGIFSFVQFIIVARVLDPELVGLVAVFFIVQGALEAFTDTGFAKAIIQRKDCGQNCVDTAFITNLCRGILLTTGVVVTAPWFVRMLGTPRAENVVQVMAIIFFLHGARNPGALFFMRRLLFYKQFIWYASGALAKFGVTVFLLFTLRNEWAIVFGLVAHELVIVVLSFILVNIRPGFNWDKAVFWSMFDYGKWILLASIVAFIERQGNQIVTVKLLGEANLGLLFIGLRISRLPMLAIQQLKNVLFPLFSRLQESLEEAKRLYQRSIGIVAFFAFPMAGCAVALAEPFTHLCLKKPAWGKVSVILGLLLCAQAVQAVCTISISLFNSRGMPNFAFLNRLMQGIILIIAIYPLVVTLEIQGIALLYLVNAVLSFVLCVAASVRCFHFDIHVFSVLCFPLFASLATSIFTYLLQQTVHIDSIPVLCSYALAFCLFYFLMAIGWELISDRFCGKTQLSTISPIKIIKGISSRFVRTCQGEPEAG